MNKSISILCLSIVLSISVHAQIKIDQLLNLDNLIGQVMSVKKGFNPKFSIGNIAIPKVNKLGEIFGMKQNADIDKLFRTFKTGRTIYKSTAYIGGAIALYGTIKAIDKAAVAKDYKGALVGGLTTIGAGVITKLLTKGAAYKAVDIFNGVAKKKLKDILSIQPASNTMGAGIFVKL